jgi:electron transfer flavoprotein alpha/beta subunit
VTVVSAGHEAENLGLEEARRSGVTRAVHVLDAALEKADHLTLGMALAAVARHVGAAIVLAGTASDEEGRGLVPAALAHHLQATITAHAEDVSFDPATPGQVTVTVCAGGRRMRLGLPCPVVLSVSPPCGVTAWAPTTIANAPPPPVETLTLAELGIDRTRLVQRPDLLGTFEPPSGKPETVSCADELVARWLAG